MVNPGRQLEKAKDVRRQSDLHEIANALDLYYSDNNCYPQSLSYGQQWSQNGVTFISKVPQDPDCRSGVGYCYVYEPDNASCPQWNALFAKLSTKPATSSSCALEQLGNCLPTNYNSLGYNYCVTLGKVDCSVVSSYTLPVVTPSPSPTPSPTPTPSLTPTSTPTSIPTSTPTSGPTSSPTSTPTSVPTSSPTPCPLNYSCRGVPLRCNIVPFGTGDYCSSTCNGVCQ